MILMPTALLICMENTFWNTGGISRVGNFVELFKKSFTLFVESGMRGKMEADIDILTNQAGPPVTEEFKAKFCKNIIECSHCKFVLLFLFGLDTFIHFLCLNTS